MLNKMETTLIRGMVADLRAWRTWWRKYHADPDRPLRRYCLPEYLRAEDAAERSILKMDLGAWLGRNPSGSDTVLACRAYAQLESLGLIERLYGGGGERTSAVRVTPDGERMARKPRAKQTRADRSTFPAAGTEAVHTVGPGRAD